MADIKEFKDVIVFLVKLTLGVHQTSQDGKFSITELANFIPALVALPGAIAGADKIPEELDDFTDDERIEIVEEILKLEIDPVQTAKIAQQAIRTAVELTKLFVDTQ